MASFSVDITEVKFAATNTGYKDITITGMPQAGVNCTITGTDASSFGYRIPGSDQNVYRVYTTGNTSIGTSSNEKTATFKITNLSDSTDYVEVSLLQALYLGKPVVRGVENVYDNIYAYYAGDASSSANLFAEYRTDNVGTYVILYVDGYEGTTTLSESWAYYTADSAYSDTGFKRIMIGAANNYDTAFRYCTITFPGSGGTHNQSTLYQNAYPSSTSGCTSPTLYTKDGGTERVTLSHSSQNVSNLSARKYYTNDGLTYSIKKTAASDYKTYWDVTIGPNSSDKILRGALLFERTATHTLFGFTIVRQDPSSGPVPTLTATPPTLSYPASGGGRTLDVTYATSLSTNESSFPSWLGATYVSTGQGSGSYTITAASNTSTSSRSFNFNLADANMSLAVPITQDAGSSSSSISVSPSSLSFGPDASYADISLTYGGSYFNTDAQEVYTWVTVNMSDTKTGKAAGTVSVASNTTTESRRGNVYFSDELGASIALPIEQAGISYALSANPSTLNIPARGGSVTTAVTYEGTLSAASLPSWLSETHTDNDANHRTYTVTAASNGPTQERTFNWRLDDDYNNMYVFISQPAAKVPSMVISPTSSSVGSSAGTVDITVRSTNISDISYDITGDWIKYKSKSGSVYTFSYEQNPTTSVREGSVTFSGGGISRTFKLTQREGEVSLVISPESKTVDREAGSVVITVSSSGISDINYTISDTWIQFFAKTGNKYKFSYDRNGTTSTREGTITFSGGGISRTFTLTQETETRLSISPASKTVDNTSGTVDITVISQGISDISYDIRDSWIKYKSKSGSVYTFSYDKNTTTSVREGNIIFSGGGESARFTLTQWAQTENFYIYPSNNIFNAYGRASGASFTNLVNAVYPVTTVVSDSWITASVDETDNRVEVTVSSNNTSGTDQVRTGTIVITDNSGASATYSITQTGDDIMFNPNPVTFKADGSGGPYELDVYCHSTLHTEDYAHPDSNTIPSWLTFKLIAGGINGILHYSITASKNTSSTPRSARVLFKETVDTEHSGYLNVTQESGQGDPLSVSPTELNYTAAGGTKSVTVSGGTGSIAVNTGSFPSWLSITSAGGGVYNITASENTGSLRSFGVWFTDEASNTVIVDVYQQASSVVLTVSPSSKSFSSAGGSQVFRVTYNTRINYNTLPSWLSIVSSTSSGSTIEYTMTAAENTGTSRSFNWVLTDAVNSVTVRILQSGTGPGPGGNVVVSPDSLVFRPDGGSSSVTVTYTGTLSINTDMFPGWLSMVSSGDTYTFSVSENIGTESRSFGVIFRSGGDTAVLNILQGGRYASFSVTPEKIEFGPDASSRTVYFGFVPSAGLGYQVKSGTGGWLSVSMNTPVATVSVTNNYGTSGSHPRRSSSIKFYNLNDPDDYVVVLVEQEGAGAVYSMWNDYFFTPDDVTEGDDFHFLISINGGQINDDFYGVSPYIEGTGRDMRHSGIVPLNISRYLNKCIEGNRYILFDDSYYKPYVWNQLWGEVYVDIKHLDKNGDIIKLYPQIMFWNDWSYKVKCYDYNRTLNDPINKKGCSGMYVPFCVYTDILDESTSYSVTKTDEIGEQVTNVLGNPHPFAGVDFAISCDRYYNAQKVEFKRGSEVVLSYDMTHCGDGYLLYRNRFGGWDSFLIEGNIKKKDSFTRSYMSRNGSYDACLYNVETVDTNVKTSYELSTSWLSDDESERLVYHLLSSPTIYFHSFKDDSTIKVNIVDSSSEYKKFKNGRNLVSYVITVEDTLTRQVNK